MSEKQKQRPDWVKEKPKVPFHDYMTPDHRVKHIPKEDYCFAIDDFMANRYIQNVTQLKTYIKGQLGAPVICLEISDEQLLDIIRDTVQFVWRYYYKEGSYRDYLCLELIPGRTHYKICQELESVVDFQTANWLGNINELFTVSHNVLYDSMLGMNNCSFNGMCYGDSSYGDVMGNFNATMVWLKQVKFDLGEAFQVSYNAKEKELLVLPSPRRKVHGLMEVVKRQNSNKIFNDFWFKELVVCKAGMVWSSALKKYTLTIAGGGQLNADSLYAQYKERYDTAMKQVYDESPNGHCIFVG